MASLAVKEKMPAKVVVPEWNCVAPVLSRLDDAELVKLQHPTPLDSEPETEWIPLSKDIAAVTSSQMVPDTSDRLCLHTAAAPLGRMVTSTVNVDVGDVVFATPAFAVALSRCFLASHCHMCFRKLRGRVVQCADCQVARYCDRDCMATHVELHTIQCDVLPQLATPRSNDRDDEAADLQTRLVLAVLAMETSMRNPYVIQDLTTYSSANESKAFLATAATLHGAIKHAPAWMTPTHIADVCRAVRFNAHPIVVDLLSASLGLGLFPDAAKMINHSCAPTTFPRFNVNTFALEFRAVAPLLPGALVTYSYLDVLGFALLEPMRARQLVLESAFQFDCQCCRCTLDKRADDDGLAVDGWLKELDLAQQRNERTRVIDVCDRLITHWTTSLGLPDNYPLMYVLQKKIDLAATHVQHLKKRPPSSADRILRVCGFS